MARWRIMGKHYLNVPGTEYEYRETNETTGKQARKVFPVPLYLDPANPGDRNYPDEIIVAHAASKLFPKDIIFVGPPTLDMEPLDEEAEAISAEMQKGWVKQHLVVEEGYNGKMIVEIGEALRSMAVSSKPSSPDDTEDLKSQLAAQAAQIAALTTLVEAEAAERSSRSARR